MTPQELNRDIKRFNKFVGSIEKPLSVSDEQVLKKEFHRLYYADQEFKFMNKNSVLIMLRLNLRFRFYSLHNFGSAIKLEEL